MSKLDIKISYKNACILKHALRDKIKTNEETKEIIGREISKGKEVLDVEAYSKFLKEIEEEQRALDAITEQIYISMNSHN